jgi:hypothetical protein
MFGINFYNRTLVVQEHTNSTKLVTYGGIGP